MDSRTVAGPFVVSAEIEPTDKEPYGAKPQDPAKLQAEIDSRLRKWLASSPPDRLSDDEIERYAGEPWETWAKLRDDMKEVFSGRDIERTFQGILFPVIRKLIAEDSAVRSLLSIGCRYAYELHLLAREFPHISFRGVDLPTHIHRMNEEFTDPNLSIHQGYALDLLESGEVQGDIVTMISTACCFKPAELDRYMRALAKSSRYVLLNELVDHLPDGRLPNPAHVAESVPNIYVGAYPGLPPHFIHNYKAAAERAGFTVIHHRIYMPEWTDVFRVEMVARAPTR
jgi:hypothetical protein